MSNLREIYRIKGETIILFLQTFFPVPFFLRASQIFPADDRSHKAAPVSKMLSYERHLIPALRESTSGTAGYGYQYRLLTQVSSAQFAVDILAERSREYLEALELIQPESLFHDPLIEEHSSILSFVRIKLTKLRISREHACIEHIDAVFTEYI